MTFHSRILIAFGAVALVPLAALGIGVRREMERRLESREQARIAALESVTRDALARESESVARRLRSLTEALADDDRFRAAILRGSAAERGYVLDWGERAMRLTGLSMLQLQDDAGRILSSGHFRDEFDRLDPQLPSLVSGHAPNATLFRARTPDGGMLALARADSFRLAGRPLTLVGGMRVDSAFLHRLSADTSLAVTLDLPAGVRAGPALPVIRASNAELVAIRSSVDRWFAGALTLTAGIVLLTSSWLASRISRPLVALAEQSASVDLARLDTDFASDRDDEIGDLARFLGSMTRRLRSSALRLRDAERRAAIGDVARQVNHDLRNGLAPIRHVLRHLAEVERDDPSTLAQVFGERRRTLDASVEYLETLAGRYARVGGRSEHRPCDVNELVREVVAGRARDDGITVQARLTSRPLRIVTDSLALRRVVENVVSNAADAVRGQGGRVTIGTETSGARAVRITVDDDGPGMSDAELTRALEDFYTTKAHGTGLGLSIVRRLAADIGWTVRIASVPGRGTRVTLDSPAT